MAPSVMSDVTLIFPSSFLLSLTIIDADIHHGLPHTIKLRIPDQYMYLCSLLGLLV